MNTHKSIYSVLGAALLFTTLTACGDSGNDDESSTTNTTPPATATDVSTTGGTTGPDVPTTSMPTTVDPDTTDPDPDTTTPGETTMDPTDTTGGQPVFNFNEDPPDAFVQIDRHAAVEAGTAGILASAGLGFNMEDLSLRDMYNKSNPVEDVANMWLGEIAESIMFFHDNLDDDLMMLGLTPATFDQTVAQAGPVIIPDTIKYDPKLPTGYPNGRALTDNVVDITLAAVLLDLSVHDITTFIGVLNPETNDVPFKDDFPFLAPPHLP